MMKSLLLFALVMMTCEFSIAKKTETRSPDDNLTKAFAQARKSQIEKVDYDNTFVFTETDLIYKGKTIIDVTLNKTDQPLSVDFLGKKLDQLIVNGTAVKTWTIHKGSFVIPAKYLKKITKIEISFTGLYSTNGHGFQRVVDPEDKNVYIYSDSEPYYAHALFPCFDQPDLKGSYQTKITAPTKWKVISNELVIGAKAETNPLMTTTIFQKTPVLSPYLYFVGAGPFVEWTDKAGKIPLVLYARQTIARYVDPDRIFDTTKKGLKFFSEYFSTPYPFSKYGQVFIPEFAWGGMENPGAVTLNEMNIFRGPANQSRYEGRDDLILHEMAHMWFGDMVTMNWWDDLWLNESFATYMAELADIRAMKAEGAVLSSISSKTWGYWQDQLVTTHPIETAVIDTRSAKGNFDGITYAKGSASLKQLHFYVGEEGFKEGLKNYFKRFAFQNTSRADFINEIAAASKVDLTKWTSSWLQSAGPHRVESKWTCENGKVNSFSIEQSANASGVFSPHKTKLGLFKLSQNKLKLQETENITFENASTEIKSVIGKGCPDFLFPNLEDHDYALYSLDEKSKDQAKAVLAGAAEENTLRLMTWNMLGQMVRDQKLSPVDYFDIALSGLEKEKDEALLAILLGRHSAIKHYFYDYLTVQQRNEIAPKLESATLTRLGQEKAQSNLQLTYFDFFVSISHTPEAQKKLSDYLSGKELPTGFVLDQDRRWNIIRQLASFNTANIKTIIDEEEKKDSSTSGKRNAFAARTAIPDKSVKEDFWKSLKNPEKIPFSTLRAASGEFHNVDQPQLSEPFVQPFFRKVKTMDWEANDDLAEIYFEGLFPSSLCTKKLLNESQKQMKQARNLTDLTRRYWLEANDELAKCVAIRK